jgi:hypothetical protein
MHNGGKIILGLIIFLGLIGFPIWYNVANDRAGYVPELEMPTDAKDCVADSAWMVGHHMDLLNDWRDVVVRDGDRFFDGPGGVRMERSLTNTCLSCHENKDQFCDKCHLYMGVTPYCWDCHIIPKEVM